MITVILKGRLGNRLFQYAAGRALAIKNNTTLRLDLFKCARRVSQARRSARELRSFKISAHLHVPYVRILASRVGIRYSPYRGRISRLQHPCFDPKILSLGDHAVLEGFFHSEKYFKHIEHEIRDDLQLINPYTDQEVSAYEKAIADSNSVGIHVRRGDYVNKPRYNVCPLSYFDRSIAYIRARIDDPSFFVVSDDIEWCRENMRIDGGNFVDIPAAKKRPLIDFRVLSLCKHAIISNSTFSWWAAWLNANPERIVVTPNRWFNNDGTANRLALRDTIPDDWVRIDV